MKLNPIAQKLNQASVLLEDTPYPELVTMLRIGAEEIQRLYRLVSVVEKVEWILNDSAYKAPEMFAEMWAERWRPMLAEALKTAPRAEPSTTNDVEFKSIEVRSPVCLDLTDAEYMQLMRLLTASCNRYEATHPTRVCWVFGTGSKITFMPLTAEEEKTRGVEFDDNILSIEISEREATPRELERRRK